MTHKHHEVVVIGGGASGLIAAIAAKDHGADVAIVEGTDRVGKKILTTGNGRCNITNSLIGFPFENYHSENPGFFNYCLNNFSVEETKNLFLSLGLPTVELEKGKMYPQSLQASSVVDILRFAVEDRNIPVYNSFKVKKIIHSGNNFKLSTQDASLDNISCGKVILACGGKSAQKTGSDGSGYNLAANLGHKIIEPIPALIQLKLEHKSLKGLSGIKFDGFGEVIVNGTSMRKEFGEILFTDYGISGPPILQLSRIASYELSKYKNVAISIDMMPGRSIDDLHNFFEAHWAMVSHRTVLESFIGVINKKLAPILLKEAGIQDIHKPCYSLEWKEKNNIINLLKNWTFKCVGTNGFDGAQVTAGGVNTKDVDPKTLQSTLVKNLYFCGEILDVDGDCGGYNLQWAWSSGFLAGKSAATADK
ncbi:NAD(P)/FAD-dependent oxidoreductase [Clostridium manihotivorum]|uniref:Aminoacetone oxidase family FAD-binding enzyme n=1 Tax=Clostridium manihotivorum TaxID=2320868 RepID=A0A3R5QQM3_9CLOT|nr:NAD(P)/FAD-dependent oxidoreductase [Clostridium manihotivorum]QAA30439.1 aminoacetone oxidase family FAD-binding enzyme [Clostridium manihotivorum]